MKQYTLLEIMNLALDAIDGDPVTTIAETDESQQVLSIMQREYFALASESDWKHLRVTGQLTALADATHPNYLKLPETIAKLELLKYNVKIDAADDDDFQELIFVEDPAEFFESAHSLNSTDSNVESITDFGGGTFLITNDAAPTRWTTIDDTYLIFDSYLATLDTTMPAAKSFYIGYKAPTWTEADGTVLTMPGFMFPAYVERVIQAVKADLQQTDSRLHSSKVIAANSRVFTTRNKTVNPRGLDRKPKYGRK